MCAPRRDFTSGRAGSLEVEEFAAAEIRVAAFLEVLRHGLAGVERRLLPRVAAAGAVLAVSASGAIRIRSTVLLTPEEIDAAAKKTVAYRPSGQ